MTMTERIGSLHSATPWHRNVATAISPLDPYAYIHMLGSFPNFDIPDNILLRQINIAAMIGTVPLRPYPPALPVLPDVGRTVAPGFDLQQWGNSVQALQSSRNYLLYNNALNRENSGVRAAPGSTTSNAGVTAALVPGVPVRRSSNGARLQPRTERSILPLLGSIAQ